MKITIYTVSDCQFSKQEKEYLQSHNLPFEEKNLEQNREWLTEMLAISNNFAGTPVTKIEKDDGTIVVLKGFTKEEFDQILGIKEELTQNNAQVNPPPQPQTAENLQTPNPQTKPEESTQPPSASPESNVTQTQEKTDEALNSILADLQEKANAQTNPQPVNQPANPNSQTPQNSTTGSLPNIPDFNDQTSNT